MSRKPFTLAAGASAVLCVGVCVLWVRSYFGDADELQLREPGPIDARWVSSEAGVLLFVDQRGDDDPRDDATQNYVSPNLLGVQYVNSFSVNARVINIVAPHWLAATATALLPAAWVATRIRRRRDPCSVYCPTCGYDLRATPDRCPECGAVPAAKGERA